MFCLVKIGNITIEILVSNMLFLLISRYRYLSLVSSVEFVLSEIWIGVSSPYMGFDDLRWFFKQMGDIEDYFALNQQLFDYIMEADVRDYGLDYQIPVGFISGSDDWTTPVKYSEDYYNSVSAPAKDFRLIDGCGHSPQYDSPKEFADALDTMIDALLN